MKMQADRPEGSNAIIRHGAEGVVVNGREHRHNVLVPWRGEIVPWAVGSFDALDDASFEALIALGPELVIFGSGSRIRFPRPALLKALMARRIGFEAMDTGELDALLDGIIAANPDEWERFCGGDGKVTGFFVGQIMKATQGKADGKVVTALLNSRRPS